MKHLLFTITLLISWGTSRASEIVFSENKGQYQAQVLFKADFPEGTLFLEKTCLTFLIRGEASRRGHSHETGNTHTDASNHSKYHCYKVWFVNSKEDITIEKKNQTGAIENYFKGSDPKKWARNVLSFKNITYKNLWPNIDLEMYQNGSCIKYDFVLRPGANHKDIRLRYEGVDGLSISNNQLKISISTGDIIENKPFAYHPSAKGRKDSVPTFYMLDKESNTISFRVKGNDAGKTLVIDPEIVFSTYSGSYADNWGFTATYDRDRNVYSGGIADWTGYPVSVGAFQEDLSHVLDSNRFNWDVAIIKYNPTGTDRLYATYLGGMYGDMVHSIVVNSQNQLVLYGTTGSPDFPQKGGLGDTLKGGDRILYDDAIGFNQGIDLFVTILNEYGTDIVASTLIGGTGNDGLNFVDSIVGTYSLNGNGALYYNYGDGARGEVILDDKDNVYIGTCTQSEDFPVVNGFQVSSAGKQDGLVMKLTPDLSSILWSSYIGGSKDDAIYSIDVDRRGNVYVAGGTMSDDIRTTDNSYRTSFGGGTTDAYVAKIAPSGGELQALSYYGSEAYDQAYFVRADKLGNVYLYGQTCAKDSSLFINARYGQPNSGQFIAKLTNDLDSIKWSTTFGTGVNSPNISPTAMSVDICNRIYIAGVGREWVSTNIGPSTYNEDIGMYVTPFTRYYNNGTAGMETTPNAYQAETDGQDFYFMVIDEDATRLDYATFFGEQLYGYDYYDTIYKEWFRVGCIDSGRDHVDGGTSRFDKLGNIYQSACASCGECQGFPVYPNEADTTKPSAWSTRNRSGNCNNAVVVFSINVDQIQSLFDTIYDPCNAKTVSFENKSWAKDMSKVEFVWYFGDSSDISHETNPTHTYSDNGSYRVTLVINDLTSCNLTDTSHFDITINDQTPAIMLDTISTCLGETTVLGDSSLLAVGTIFKWSPPDGLSSDTAFSPTVSIPKSTTFTVQTLSDNCKRNYQQHVIIYDSNFTSRVAVLGGQAGDKFCPGITAMLKASSNQPHDTIIWSTDIVFENTLKPTEADSLLDFTPIHDTTIYMKATSKCGRVCVDSVKLFVEKQLELGEDKNICLNQSTTLSLQLPPWQAMLPFQWEPSNIIASGQGSNSVVVKPTKRQTITVSTKTPGGCYLRDSLDIEVDSSDIDTLTFNDISCYGDNTGSVIVKNNGREPVSYEWSDNTKGATRVGLGAGTYTVTATDMSGCVNVATFVVGNIKQLAVESHAVASSCDKACNGAVRLKTRGGTPPYRYQWSNGNTSKDINQLCIGQYIITITDNNNCVRTDTIHIHHNNRLPFLDAKTDKRTIFQKQEVKLQAAYSPSDTVTYSWIPGKNVDFPSEAITNARPDSTTVFTVYATDKHGCTAIDTLVIHVKYTQCDTPFIFIPNAFTPNGDKLNDEVKVKGSTIESLYFAIFDRWGEKVFDTNDMSVGWDGTYKGKTLSPAVFVYYLEATCINREKAKLKGNITLIK